jgi:hypothetical protein
MAGHKTTAGAMASGVFEPVKEGTGSAHSKQN